MTDTGMEDVVVSKWWAQMNGRTLGPFDSNGIVRLVRSGQLRRGNLIREESDTLWMPVEATEFGGALPSLLSEATRGAAPRKEQAPVNNGLAAVFSFLVAGLGHIYKGRFGEAAFYFFAVYLCYAIGWILFWPLWFVGFILHGLSIFGAYSAQPAES